MDKELTLSVSDIKSSRSQAGLRSVGNGDPRLDVMSAGPDSERQALTQQLQANREQMKSVHVLMTEHTELEYLTRPLHELTSDQLIQLQQHVEVMLERSQDVGLMDQLDGGLSINPKTEPDEDSVHEEERIARINEALLRNPNFEYQGRALDNLSTPELDELLKRVEQYERDSKGGVEAPLEQPGKLARATELPESFEPIALAAQNSMEPQLSAVFTPVTFAMLDTSFSLPSGASVSADNFYSVSPDDIDTFWDVSTPAVNRPSPFLELLGKLLSKLLRIIGIGPKKPSVKNLARRVIKSDGSSSNRHSKLKDALERSRKSRGIT